MFKIRSFFSIILSGVILVLLSGCGGKQVKSNQPHVKKTFLEKKIDRYQEQYKAIEEWFALEINMLDELEKDEAFVKESAESKKAIITKKLKQIIHIKIEQRKRYFGRWILIKHMPFLNYFVVIKEQNVKLQKMLTKISKCRKRNATSHLDVKFIELISLIEKLSAKMSKVKDVLEYDADLLHDTKVSTIITLSYCALCALNLVIGLILL